MFLHVSVSPVNIYSKLFLSANCEYDISQGNDTSNFCPGYYDSIETPYEGSKESKLQDMSDVFCAYCSKQDLTCLQLFCAPDRLIVSVAMTMMSSFCDGIQNTFPSCYSEFCSSSVSKREANQQTDRLGTSNECTPTSDWISVAGMDQWCQSNCAGGNDPDKCPESHCTCPEIEETTATVTTVSANNLGTSCLQWEASVIWSGVPGMDSWCQLSCTRSGQCPESHCQCKENLPVTSTQSSTITLSSPSASSSTTNVESQGVVSQVVCDHANTVNHNVLTDRYCNQQGTTDYKGYNNGILDQVLSFAPKILCALTNTAGRGETCPNMFCGENPLSQQLIKTSLCSVCQQFSETLAPTCAMAYCS
ncbi:uncharacterized protein LOC132750086 isoform X2 [Ruditapes philippinarum]|uniref:uncharacterized protein LOC132750086 isoform X2 n=1 Tax=Ruditapes philippinarum TaxID=129788 RepID=UPI00295A60C4|nr:uncharacterized protein LOC132750086 isoform X2 [Ruditapes philippinarum]